MTRRNTFLTVQTLLCILTAGLLAAAALTLYSDGAARQAQGDLFEYIFTREKAGAKLLPILPFFFAAFGMTVAGLILGVRDENQDRPVRDEKQLRDLSGIRERAVHQAADQKVMVLRVALIVLAAALIIAGILNGGLEDVLAKGTAVCTECVGLG